jgi:GTP pyrophosphokinase
VGSKVNGKIVPLRYVLKTGDICEVLTSANQKPNKDWLAFVKSGRARTKIRNSVRKEQRDRSKELGRELLNKELKRVGTNLREAERKGKLAAAVEKSKFNTVDEMLAAVGYGKAGLDAVVDKIVPPEGRPQKSSRPATGENKLEQLWGKLTQRATKGGVVLDGIEDIMVSFAKCCNPVPGDDITGFVTRGRGLSVHQRDCEKVTHLDQERMIPVSWAAKNKGESVTRHAVNVRVFCTDKTGILAAISQSFSDSGVNISQAHCLTTDDERAVNTFEVLVSDLDQLRKAMKRIGQIKGVYRVERA